MAQTTKSQIESELHRLAELIGAQPEQLPTIDNSREVWPNISFSSDGTAYYEAHERGDELFSFPAFDLEHLMFMAFKDITFSMAIELMRTLNSEWAERTQKEIDATLRTAPFDDRLTTK